VVPSTFSAAGSPARTSASPDNDAASPAAAPASSTSSPASPGLFDLDGYSSRTYPGLLSSNGGRDFGVVLGTLADLGYGLGWRVLDSRFFGVPQRRRRVFVVGALIVDDPRAAAERAGQVLAVGSRCPGHPATRGEAEQGADHILEDGSGSSVARPLGSLADGGYRTTDLDGVHAFVSVLRPGREVRPMPRIVEQAMSAKWAKGTSGPAGDECQNLVAVSIAQNQRRESEIAMQLTTGGGKPGEGYSAVREGMSVRRMTPTECERLQGLDDGWTNPDGTAPDGRRYAGLGDAVTATVGHWLGARIRAADEATA
jgi:DNA (cytosine-5)-methyltransferase 1